MKPLSRFRFAADGRSLIGTTGFPRARVSYGVFSAGPVHVRNLKTNAFMHVKVHHKHIQKYAG